jgi:hypothetical protein
MKLLYSLVVLLVLAVTSFAQSVASMSDQELLAKMKLAEMPAKNLATVRALFANGYFDPRDNSFNSGNLPHDLATRNAIVKRSKENAQGYWLSFGPRNMAILDANGEYHLVHFVDFQTKGHYEPGNGGGSKFVEDGPRRGQLPNGRWLNW